MGHSYKICNEANLSPIFRTKKQPQKNHSTLWYLILFFVPFTVYLITLCPTFLDDDSPETITAGLTLGIQHPPGYPLAALMVRLASLIPLGGLCFRVNAASTLLASAAVFLLFHNISLVLERLFNSKGSIGKTLSAAGGALVLAFSKTFWEKALGAKGMIYLLETLLLLALLYCLLQLKEIKPQVWGSCGWLAAFLFGLGLAHHWETQLLFIPPLLIVFFLAQKDRGKTGAQQTVLASSFGLLGLSPLLFLPLRAHLHPTLNLGAPDTLTNLIPALTRRYYAFRELSLFRETLNVWQGSASWGQWRDLASFIWGLQSSQIGVHLREDLQWPALALSLVGLGAWWKTKERKILLFLLLPFAFLAASLCVTLWIPANVHLRWFVDNYLLPANWILAILAAAGIYATALQFRVAGFLPTLALALIAPLYLLACHFPMNNQQKQVLRYDYGVNLLKSMPRNTLFFGESDEDNFPLFYLLTAEKKRPDVEFIPAFILFESWGVSQVQSQYPDLNLDTSSQSFPDVFSRIQYASSEIIGKNQDRLPCAFSYFNGAFHRFYMAQHPHLLFRQSGILLELAAPPAMRASVLSLSRIRTRHWDDCPSNQHEILYGIRRIYGLMGLHP